jgi:hypothetical protein
MAMMPAATRLAAGLMYDDEDEAQFAVHRVIPAVVEHWKLLYEEHWLLTQDLALVQSVHEQPAAGVHELPPGVVEGVPPLF